MPKILEITDLGNDNARVRFDDGSIYYGEWNDGKAHKYGIIYFCNGVKYEGNWKDGKMHGHGTYFFSNEIRYEGAFEDDKRHGHGTYFFSNEISVSGIFYKDIFIPPIREKTKPERQFILLEAKKDLLRIGDQSPAIIAAYGTTQDQIRTVDEATPIPAIEELVCDRKDGLGTQIAIMIRSHGGPSGKLENPNFIKEKLGEILDKIKTYNGLSLDEKKIKRVKLNLSVCHGDACITNPDFIELIREFTNAGIEVRTSAIRGDLAASAIIGNGKNAAEGDGNKTIIRERLFTSSGLEAEKFKRDKSKKYLALELEEFGQMLCASGEKHYESLEDFLRGRYTKPPTTEPNPSTTSSASENLHPSKPCCVVS